MAAPSLEARLAAAADAHAAARAVVEHLGRTGVEAHVHLECGGCHHVHGPADTWTLRDAAPADASAPHAADAVRLDDLVVALEAADTPADSRRRCLDALVARLRELGEPRPAPVHRLAARLAALETVEELERELLDAARELTGLGSALLADVDALGRLAPRRAVGPLAPALSAPAAPTLAVLESLLDVRLAAPALDPRLEAAGARSLLVAPLAASGAGAAAGSGAGRRLLVLADASGDGPSLAAAEALELLALQAAACLRAAEAGAELRERAGRDPLTGLGGHAAFHEALARARADHEALAVVVVDVEGFRSLNARAGRRAGDRVLVEVASALADVLRRGDALFRVGADAFAALVAVVDEPEAREVAERLRAACAVPVSAGVALPAAGETDAAVLARAEAGGAGDPRDAAPAS